MTNRYQGICQNCGMVVAPGNGRWRMIPKQAQNFMGLRCKVRQIHTGEFVLSWYEIQN